MKEFCTACLVPKEDPKPYLAVLADAAKLIERMADEFLEPDWRRCLCPGSKEILDTLKDIKECK